MIRRWRRWRFKLRCQAVSNTMKSYTRSWQINRKKVSRRGSGVLTSCDFVFCKPINYDQGLSRYKPMYILTNQLLDDSINTITRTEILITQITTYLKFENSWLQRSQRVKCHAVCIVWALSHVIEYNPLILVKAWIVPFYDNCKKFSSAHCLIFIINRRADNLDRQGS